VQTRPFPVARDRCKLVGQARQRSRPARAGIIDAQQKDAAGGQRPGALGKRGFLSGGVHVLQHVDERNRVARGELDGPQIRLCDARLTAELILLFLYLGALCILPLQVPASLQFVLLVTFTFTGCFLSYELIIRRIRFLHPLFGLKPQGMRHTRGKVVIAVHIMILILFLPLL